MAVKKNIGGEDIEYYVDWIVWRGILKDLEGAIGDENRSIVGIKWGGKI